VTAGGAASMTLAPVGATGTSDAIHSELSGGTTQVKDCQANLAPRLAGVGYLHVLILKRSL
jgi:hypothetical protein